MIDGDVSKKIKVVSFFSILMVVFIHASDLAFKDNRLVYSNGYWLKDFIQFFLSQGVARAAVPLFFCIAGFLFFQNTSGQIFDWYSKKLKSRFKSLVIPYLLWTAFSAALFLLLLRYGSSGVFSEGVIQKFGGKGAFELVLLHPVAYQFWFVRDLIFLALISPFIYLMLTRLGLGFLFLLMLCLVVDVTVPLFGVGSALYFSLGGYLALNSDTKLAIGIQASRLLLIFWIALILMRDIAFVKYRFVFYQIDVLSSGLGMLAVWLNYDILYRRFESVALKYSGATFFVFCAHEPALWVYKKMIHHFFDGVHSGLVFLCSYFLLPVAWIYLLVMLSLKIRSQFPRIYFYINGGR